MTIQSLFGIASSSAFTGVSPTESVCVCVFFLDAAGWRAFPYLVFPKAQLTAEGSCVTSVSLSFHPSLLSRTFMYWLSRQPHTHTLPHTCVFVGGPCLSPNPLQERVSRGTCSQTRSSQPAACWSSLMVALEELGGEAITHLRPRRRCRGPCSRPSSAGCARTAASAGTGPRVPRSRPCLDGGSREEVKETANG